MTPPSAAVPTEIAPLRERSAHVIFDTLVEHAGASEYWRKQFVLTMTSQPCAEFRFQGSLGVSGTFRRCAGERANGTVGEKWRVECDACDCTAERTEAMERTNAALALLQNVQARTA